MINTLTKVGNVRGQRIIARVLALVLISFFTLIPSPVSALSTIRPFSLAPFLRVPASPVPLVSAQEVVDRMVATVNAGVRSDLITYSDLVWQLALQPNTPLVSPNSQDLNRALRLVIDQRLILQEAEKLPTIAPTAEEVKNARDQLSKAFPSPAEFQQRLMLVGLTAEKLDEILEQRVRIEKYLDFRFRNFVLISQKEITDYYNDIYVARVRARRQIVPTLEEARAEIESTLTEAKIESDTDAFLDSARERAEIVTLSAV
jgi:hypothetical protein